MHGFILLNKPPGPTSHDVVEEVRGLTEISRVGHAGTLDPFAEGLLILLVGDFTKRFSEFAKLSKKYRAVLLLGVESNTHDIEGETVPRKEVTIPLREDVEGVLEKFRGKITQLPPQFSALKSKGKRAYAEAREGREVKLEAREVVINELGVIWYRYPFLTLEVLCSSGTYIRALGRDIGNGLGTGATVIQLRRLAIGPCSLKDAVDLQDLTSRNWTQFLRTSPLESPRRNSEPVIIEE